jgi:hypothetical protein
MPAAVTRSLAAAGAWLAEGGEAGFEGLEADGGALVWPAGPPRSLSVPHAATASTVASATPTARRALLIVRAGWTACA